MVFWPMAASLRRHSEKNTVDRICARDPRLLNSSQYIDVSKRNLLIFDDLMTEAKCEQRIADFFTKGSHHRNISIVYLTQNLFPQGKACRDIALNTQYLMLFNNPIDRQQVATLARRIYPSTSAIFMKRFEQATSRPYGHLVVYLKSSTPEQDRLHTDIFETLDIRKLDSEDERNLSDVDGESVAHSEDKDEESMDLANEDFINNLRPPGKRRNVAERRTLASWHMESQISRPTQAG